MLNTIPFQITVVAVMRLNEQTEALQPEFLLEGGTAELEEGQFLCIVDGPGAELMLEAEGHAELFQINGYPWPLIEDAFECMFAKDKADPGRVFHRSVDQCPPDFRASITRAGGKVTPLYKAETIHAEMLRLATEDTRSKAALALSQLDLDKALILLRRAAGEPGLNSFLRGDMDRYLKDARLTAEGQGVVVPKAPDHVNLKDSEIPW